MREFASLYELFEAIPDEDAALAHFRAVRWQHGEFCPYCGHGTIYQFSDDRTYKCQSCRKRFSIKVGTIFEGTLIPMRKWLAVIWLITAHKKGIASTQLARDLHVTQKTAWFMLHRLRHGARTRSFNRPLKGEVEVDESFFDCKEKNKHTDKRGKDDKVVAVIGARRRVARPSAEEPQRGKAGGCPAGPARRQRVTDEWPGYQGLSKRFHHHTVNLATYA